ncbi:2-C-methyl-D-erythritol 2,4-cyclodiphosphate synthase [Malacoplasma iowae]|uniref:2-C-methyl-D-erythritol 2,4-cyclodiphosphate synthase n=2 Tax=Malacoplasma iowae TaxID=2116 RepID=A0A084U3H4_MALIO|nr:2-C-methyl-D-erythritol 2,4-cyclodiphosphate synthase [Malacoplasma iowae]VEU62215.1 2-C-methyl-D-erythritol 2,4-cyclo diphosphate synthase [Mycoplasmopsis fermentans]EGZ31666.1 2-C-methyl-D-erythritol 2,4-cyclodiphosphate synthase [Malacoplasma iowae 695]KFB07510.1 2-C-methyl-D-erythritol-2,4-cyclodiphosphate synthase [Malacoplasma iowae DK-CPA]QHG89911.1 2-C-methyl-D-erythritol 2,4-cyclodiphosphate synthase [Malacoplasma iowae 695]WPL35277.1 2-C-methyl-D-erythritol 2,4-cyclodiphosphate sy
MILIGNSTDIHKIIEEKNSWQKLSGMIIKSDYKIVAHSDGDIILHSIIDAILGALGVGDIGEYFSDSDPKNKNINSLTMLQKVISIMHRCGFKINNVDITFISEHIMLANYKFEMRMLLRKILNCNNVSLKATRWEENKLLVQSNCSLILKSI